METFALTALLAIFVSVGLYTLVALRPQSIRTIEVDRYDPYLDDFVVYYAAADLLLEGNGADAYQLQEMREAEARAVGWPLDRTYTLPFFNPPPVLILIAPLALLPLGAAAVAWIGMNLAAGLSTTGLLLRSLPSGRSLLATAVPLAAIVSSPPFYQVAVHGQTTLVLALGLVLWWLGIARRGGNGKLAAGLLLLTLKPQLLALPLLLTAIQLRWRALMWWGIGVATLYSLAVALLGSGTIRDHVDLLIQASRWREQNGISVWGMFGWNAFVEALLRNASESQKWIAASVLSGFTMLACSYIFLRRRQNPSDPAVFLALSAGTILISPHLYQHDVLLLAPPLCVGLSQPTAVSRYLYGGVGLILWLLAYYHFDLLTATRLNFTTLSLAFVVTSIAISSLAYRPVWRIRHQQTKWEATS